MLPHRIALRGPWIAISATGESRTFRLPQQWDEAVQFGTGPLRLVRRFGWLAQLAPHERLWLLVTHDVTTSLSLNGRLLPATSGVCSIELSEPLKNRNELMIEFERSPLERPICFDVALEVRGQAWLDGLSAVRDGEVVTIRGRLMGNAESPLDLYAILNRRTLAHATLHANVTNPNFALTSQPLDTDTDGEEVRIELIQGGNIWHAADLPIRRS